MIFPLRPQTEPWAFPLSTRTEIQTLEGKNEAAIHGAASKGREWNPQHVAMPSRPLCSPRCQAGERRKVSAPGCPRNKGGELRSERALQAQEPSPEGNSAGALQRAGAEILTHTTSSVPPHLCTGLRKPQSCVGFSPPPGDERPRQPEHSTHCSSAVSHWLLKNGVCTATSLLQEAL